MSMKNVEYKKILILRLMILHDPVSIRVHRLLNVSEISVIRRSLLLPDCPGSWLRLLVKETEKRKKKGKGKEKE